MSDQFPNVEAGHKYAVDVVEGRIPAGKYIILACKRHLGDMRAAKNADEYPYYFDDVAAERVCKFIQFFPHVKGKWARSRESVNLEPWQRFFLISIFGWKRKSDDMRRFRNANLWVPRKNGKSFLAGGIGLYMLAADGEHGAEVYAGATSEKQAWEVFRPAQDMAKKVPEFLECYDVHVNASNIATAETMSRFEPIIGNPPDGSSPHLAIIDEYHEHKDDRAYETMITGMGAREQPLMLMITTAGNNIAGPCFQLQLESQKILDDVVEDEETFSLIYGIDKEDDWDDVNSLRKANPNIGVSVSEEFLLARLQDAKNNARKQSTYKTKHLNVWVGAKDAFFNVEKWRDLGDTGLKLEDFKGRRIYIGLDLASKIDVAALEILIDPLEPEGDFVRFGKYFLPESALEDGATDHYKQWDIEGWLTVTDGNIIDFNVIKEYILELSTDFELVELAYDPFQATMLITELMAEGVPCIELRATVQNFSEPMKQLEALIKDGKIKHSGDPVMSWFISNVVAKVDAKDNVYPRKDRDENKIDGVISLIMAINRSMNEEHSNLSAALDNFLSVKL